MDLLAAALAEIGDFNAAIRTATTALTHISSANEGLRTEIDHRIQLYRRRQPYRDSDASGVR